MRHTHIYHRNHYRRNLIWACISANVVCELASCHFQHKAYGFDDERKIWLEKNIFLRVRELATFSMMLTLVSDGLGFLDFLLHLCK